MRASRRSSFTVGIVGAVLKPLDVFVHVPGNGPSGYCGEASLVLLPRYVSFDSCGFEEFGQRFYLWPLLALIRSWWLCVFSFLACLSMLRKSTLSFRRSEHLSQHGQANGRLLGDFRDLWRRAVKIVFSSLGCRCVLCLSGSPACRIKEHGGHSRQP